MEPKLSEEQKRELTRLASLLSIDVTDELLELRRQSIISYVEQLLKEEREKLLKQLEEFVNEKVHFYHKTCLTDMFDNGHFFAFKDMQQELRKLKSQEEQV